MRQHRPTSCSTLCERDERPYVIFRDPLFSQDRDRVRWRSATQIDGRGLTLRFECETRLDRLDPELLDRMHAAGLRAMSFGVESLFAEHAQESGPPADSHRSISGRSSTTASELGIVTAAFYVLGFLEDDWTSIGATIDYAVALGSTLAQFKLLTPYPGTPLWKQMAPRVFETDWQKFDGFTPTFHHPSLTPAELTFLLGAAYTRFYMRPSWLANYLGIGSSRRAPLRATSWTTGVRRVTRARRLPPCRRAVVC